MIRPRLFATTLALAIAAGLPGAAVAQDEVPPTPEGVEWALTTFLDPRSDEVEPVPYDVRPTLLLQDGTASGFGGCNRFSGSYELDGSSLRFDEELSVTLALCDDEVQAVEDGYLAALGEVEGWIDDAGRLKLSDGFGEAVLTFEVPTILWTAGQLDGLMARLERMTTLLDAAGLEIESLNRQLEGQDVGRLRQRIRDLESENKQLKKRIDALEESPPSSSQGSAGTSFSKAERILLEGVPQRIANTCEPLRSSLPKGTRAAVTCTPNTTAVSSVAYHLLEGDAAADTFGDTMAAFDVPDATSGADTCEQGVKSQRFWIGNGWQAEGCYRADRRAELRVVDNATDCRKLKVGGKTLRSPAFYIEVQGQDNDLERVHAWVTKNLAAGSTQLTGITQPIDRPNAGRSPSCPT